MGESSYYSHENEGQTDQDKCFDLVLQQQNCQEEEHFDQHGNSAFCSFPLPGWTARQLRRLVPRNTPIPKDKVRPRDASFRGAGWAGSLGHLFEVLILLAQIPSRTSNNMAVILPGPNDSLTGCDFRQV